MGELGQGTVSSLILILTVQYGVVWRQYVVSRNITLLSNSIGRINL